MTCFVCRFLNHERARCISRSRLPVRLATHRGVSFFFEAEIAVCPQHLHYSEDDPCAVRALAK